MRNLIALLLVSATTVFIAPSAGACHLVGPIVESEPLDGWYVIPDVGYDGCPHELSACLQVWRETNGEPGLQRYGWNPDQAVVIVCPIP